MDCRRRHNARSAGGKSYLYGEPYRAGPLEKLYLNKIEKPYRKPTQVDKRKYAKVNGLNLVKELGKQVAVSSQYGLPKSARILGCNKRFSTDCLSKTQLRANS